MRPNEDEAANDGERQTRRHKTEPAKINLLKPAPQGQPSDWAEFKGQKDSDRFDRSLHRERNLTMIGGSA